ncbi:MAG: T9SS type A sorting domain-containing protein [candidate division Zixibacteria bacterium]|nr:T9SS type A sorting domain-containing protein [candidate division Zixibacteria bacterium]
MMKFIANIKPERSITVALIVCVMLLFTGGSRAENIIDGYLNGIYFDENGQPQLHSTLDTLEGLLDTIPVPGTWPTGLVDDGVFYWTSDSDSSKLYKFWTLTEFDALLHGYAGLGYDGVNLWAVYESDFMLYKIDMEDGTRIDSLDLPVPDSAGIDRHAWGLAWDGQYLWHSQYGVDAMIFKLDTATGAVVDSFASPAQFMLGITWAPPYICGVDMVDGILYRMNPDSGNVVDTYPWEVPYPLGLYWDGEYFHNVSSKAEYGGDNVIYQVSLAVDIEEEIAKPESIELAKAYPNPFNASTNINYSLAKPSSVRIDIYNILGRRVETVFDGYQLSGTYTINWRADDLPSGIYYARIAGDKASQSIKLTLLK